MNQLSVLFTSLLMVFLLAFLARILYTSVPCKLMPNYIDPAVVLLLLLTLTFVGKMFKLILDSSYSAPLGPLNPHLLAHMQLNGRNLLMPMLDLTLLHAL